MSAPRRPLDDITVLALEQFGAGPFGSLQLAELGATVVKIEDPGQQGDVGRYTPPYQEGEDSLFFESFNHDKRSISLDLRNPAGLEVFHDLVGAVDAVYSNLRGDLPHRLGLTYAQLADRNPRIVCCSLSGFGMTGPRAAQPAYDYMLQGLSGWMSICGEPGGPPTKTGLSLVDMIGGTVAALSLLAAVHAARRDGRGCDCDISLHESALSFLNYVGTWHLAGGYAPERVPLSGHPSIVPFQNLPTQDGWVVVACAKEKFWQALCVAMERPDVAEDPRYRTMKDRHVHREALVAQLCEIFRRRPTDHWLRVLSDAGVPNGPVHDVAEAFDDPQVAAREVIAEYPHPRFGTVRTMRSAARVGDERPPLTRAPFRGEHTASFLAERLGYAPERLRDLRSAGAFG